MGCDSEAVQWYRQLAAGVSRMLELAQRGEWSDLPELDAHCTVIVDRLREWQPLAIAADDSARITALTLRIERDQKALAALIAPQLADLMRKIERLQRQRRVQTTYGSHS